MSNEMFTQLPTVANAQLTDIICAVQGYVSPSTPGTSVQETLQQVLNLMQSNIVLNNAGNPNGAVAGVVYQLCWDTTNKILYVCTTSGSASTAVWIQAAGLIPASLGGTGVVSPAIHELPVAQGAGAFNFLGPLTNGQLLIGSTSNDPVAASISAGTGIAISNGAGTITISTAGAGTGWTDVTGTSQAMTSNNGYVADNVGLVTLTLPTTSALGDTIYIMGKGSGGWSVTYTTNQLIHIGSSPSTVTTGNIASTNQYDSIKLVCITANLIWASAGGPEGNITIV